MITKLIVQRVLVHSMNIILDSLHRRRHLLLRDFRDAEGSVVDDMMAIGRTKYRYSAAYCCSVHWCFAWTEPGQVQLWSHPRFNAVDNIL